MNTQRINEHGILPTDVVLKQLEEGKQRAYLKGALGILGVAAAILFIGFATAQLGVPADYMVVP